MLNLILTLTPLAPYQIFLVCLGVVAGLIILWQIACLIMARFVLCTACTPVRHTFEEVRQRQTSVEHVDYTDYDNNWNKKTFDINGLHGKLRGEVIYNSKAAQVNGRQKAAIICHGHTMNRLNSLKYAEIFYNSGYNVIIYDHAYFGESEGKFCTLGYYERADLSIVIDYARGEFGNDCFIALHGESMGAATVLSVLGLRSDVDLVVADCPFSDTEGYYRELFEHLFHLPSRPIVDYFASMAKTFYGYDFSKCRPIEDVKGSDVPICFIHGRADDFIFPHHSEDMYAVCRNSLSELHLFDGAGHARSHLTDKALYTRTVTGFLDKVERVAADVQSTATRDTM